MRSGDGEWTTFVLIPGAGADPQVYEATIEALHDLGHDGIAPPPPLDDPDAGPSEHADVIAALPDPRPNPLLIVASRSAPTPRRSSPTASPHGG